ncbi:MAG: hypothetical protein ACMUJM_13005 [bacterium]
MDKKIFRNISLIIFSFFIGFGPKAITAQITLPALKIAYQVSNPWSSYLYDQTLYRDLFSYSDITQEAATNPFSTYESFIATQRDPFSSSFVNTSSYANIMGIAKQSGVASYANAFFQTSGGYLDYLTPGMAFTTDSAYYTGLTGAGSSYTSILDTPWFHYGTSIASETAAGTAATPFGILPAQSFEVSTEHAAFGKETPYSLTMHPAAAGVFTLREYAPSIMAMDRQLSESPMITETGMKFYGTTAYYNPASASHWFFPSEISKTEARVDTVGGTPMSGYYTASGVGSAVYSPRASVMYGSPAASAVSYSYGAGAAPGVGTSMPLSGRGVVTGVTSGAYAGRSYAGPVGGMIATPAGVPAMGYGSGGVVMAIGGVGRY